MNNNFNQQWGPDFVVLDEYPCPGPQHGFHDGMNGSHNPGVGNTYVVIDEYLNPNYAGFHNRQYDNRQWHPQFNTGRPPFLYRPRGPAIPPWRSNEMRPFFPRRNCRRPPWTFWTPQVRSPLAQQPFLQELEAQNQIGPQSTRSPQRAQQNVPLESSLDTLQQATATEPRPTVTVITEQTLPTEQRQPSLNDLTHISINRSLPTSVTVPQKTSWKAPPQALAETQMQTSTKMPPQTSTKMPLQTPTKMPPQTLTKTPPQISTKMPLQTSVKTRPQTATKTPSQTSSKTLSQTSTKTPPQTPKETAPQNTEVPTETPRATTMQKTKVLTQTSSRAPLVMPTKEAQNMVMRMSVEDTSTSQLEISRQAPQPTPTTALQGMTMPSSFQTHTKIPQQAASGSPVLLQKPTKMTQQNIPINTTQQVLAKILQKSSAEVQQHRTSSNASLQPTWLAGANTPLPTTKAALPTAIMTAQTSAIKEPTTTTLQRPLTNAGQSTLAQAPTDPSDTSMNENSSKVPQKPPIRTVLHEYKMTSVKQHAAQQLHPSEELLLPQELSSRGFKRKLSSVVADAKSDEASRKTSVVAKIAPMIHTTIYSETLSDHCHGQASPFIPMTKPASEVLQQAAFRARVRIDRVPSPDGTTEIGQRSSDPLIAHLSSLDHIERSGAFDRERTSSTKAGPSTAPQIASATARDDVISINDNWVEESIPEQLAASGSEQDTASMASTVTSLSDDDDDLLIVFESRSKPRDCENENNISMCNEEQQKDQVNTSIRAEERERDWAVEYIAPSCHLVSPAAAEKVLFELNAYTACCVLDMCKDSEAKQKVLQLYTDGKQAIGKTAYNLQIQRTVTEAVETKRILWKGASGTMRKLAKIRWSVPSGETAAPPMSLYIQQMQEELVEAANTDS